MAGVLQDEVSVFGGDLTALCERQKKDVPTFLVQFMQYIEDEAAGEVGVYRVSGDKKLAGELKSLVQDTSGEDVDFCQEWIDFKVVTDCLKLYLKELPEPLMPSYEDWSDIAGYLKTIPEANYETLKAVIKHLSNISGLSQLNKMPAANFGIIFGTLLVHSDKEPKKMFALHQNDVVTMMIEKYNDVFCSSDEISEDECSDDEFLSSEPQSSIETDESSDESIKGAVRKVKKRPAIKWLSAAFSSAFKKSSQDLSDVVFGCDLPKFCESQGTAVPPFLTQFMEYIEAVGSQVKGIYRVTGSLQSVKRLKNMIDKGEEFDLESLEWASVHVVTSCLKLYLKELPEPLVPFSLYKSLIEAAKCSTTYDKVSRIEMSVQQLSWTSYSTLKTLMQHLRNIDQYHEVNQMTSKNLGVVFGPVIMRAEDVSSDSKKNSELQNVVVELMVDYHESIFE